MNVRRNPRMVGCKYCRLRFISVRASAGWEPCPVCKRWAYRFGERQRLLSPPPGGATTKPTAPAGDGAKAKRIE